LTASELEALNRLLDEKNAALVLPYGRRRVGKTRLVQEFVKGSRAHNRHTQASPPEEVANKLK